MGQLYDLLKRLFLDINASEGVAAFIAVVLTLTAIFFVSAIVDIIVKKVLIRIIAGLVKRTAVKWDDILFRHKVFNTISHMAPATVIYVSSGFAGSDFPRLEEYIRITVMVYIIGVLITAGNRLLNSFLEIYSSYSFAAERPIKGYLQTLKIVIYLVGAIFIIAEVTGKNPTNLFTGLGAMAAVLMLVFKDAILGFVASIQLAANKMVKQGDWISMPKYGADGTVEDISLTTVKVQNWDKTITTIPTYALVSESVTNWIGMEQSGGRRIKRSFNIDMRSVRFCDKELLDKLSKFALIRDYIHEKEQEIKDHNEKMNYSSEEMLFGRKQTNLGICRRYLETYLHDKPKVHDNMTFLVRYLQPSEKGLPIEIYVFSNDQRWANYEAIQADIFDHILAVISVFELRVFQSPAGDDITKIVESIRN